MIRTPLSLDGTPQTGEAGVEWRVAPSERPDAAHRTEYRAPGDTDWTVRYVFDDASRPLHYFEAANDDLQSAPESPFTGEPTVALSTEVSSRKLSGHTLVEATRTDRHERIVSGDAWHEVLAQDFVSGSGLGRIDDERDGRGPGQGRDVSRAP